MKRALIFLACCGGSSGPVAMQPEGPAAASIAVPAPDDVQVATVEGRAVWGSCVADQIKRFPKLGKQEALAQCIDFEVLAQQAERKQLATDREVVEATRTTLVRRLIDAFEAKYPNPDSLSAQIDQMFQKAGTSKRPELRASFYALVAVDKKGTEAQHAAARRAAEQLYAKLANETGLFSDQVKDAAAGIQPGEGLTFEFADYGAVPKDNRRTAPEYIGALFGIAEVGRVSPVVKTEFGYHVILLTELRPEAPIEREQVFAGLRRNLFVQYVTELMKSSAIEVHAELLEPPADEAAP